VIRVHDRQRGGVIIRVPLTILGGGNELVGDDGAETGIDVQAPGVRIADLTIRGFATDDASGRSAAIVLDSSGTRVDNVSFLDNRFALSAIRASFGTISGSHFRSTDPNGDPIRFWRSHDMKIVNTVVTGGRDVFISWSPNVVIEGSLFSHLRYGLHDMFSPNMTVQQNMFEDCEIGTNFMYAQGLRVTENRFVRNAGPTGYGIGLEDTDGAAFRGNLFAANHVGMHIVDSPATPSARLYVEDNLFASNGAALALQSDARSISVVGNAFANNTEQVEVSGGGSTPGITWSGAQSGNYWSDYAGFARQGSSIGALAYRPNSAFESVLDANPDLQIFRESAAAGAIDFATRALASQPEPKLVDEHPLLRTPVHDYAVGAPAQDSEKPSTTAMLLASALGVPLATILASVVYPTSLRRKKMSEMQPEIGTAIEFDRVTKQYGRNRGIDDICLTVKVGEAVALWGPNGAGKTTLLRCVLGETSFRGRIAVFGRDRASADERINGSLGYAPQHLPDFDMPISRVVRMLAELRGVEFNDVRALFAEFGLDPDDDRFVAELSGGLRQRLGVACALIGDPPLLILDEPTAGLDRASRRELLDVLTRLRARGKTMLFTSHLATDIRALADRVIVMEDGHIADDVPAPHFEGIAS
jgi:nitrous oxidase accessory protein NosD/ABC-type Mn2+/Zn2+ transport system ATPase subunit